MLLSLPQQPTSLSSAYVPPRIDRRIRGGIRAGFEAAVEAGYILGKDAYIKEIATMGGRGFVDRLAKFGRTKNGDPLVLRRWYLEICEALADTRIGKTVSTGCSRSGKSLSIILCSVDQAVAGGLEIGYIYADAASRDNNSATEWRPIADAWIKAIEDEVGSALASIEDTKTTRTWQFDGTAAHFRYAGGGKVREGKPSMGNAATGYTANTLFQDEVSQYPSGVSFASRLNDSVFSTLPERLNGTPGAGGGIETFAREVDHYFIPHYRCRSCHAEKPLDPYGCLLQPIAQNVQGKRLEVYLSKSNRPLDWWRTDENNPIETAKICCSNCGVEIPEIDRTENAWMRCKNTGIDLRTYLDDIPPGDTKSRKIALHFSPLCREGRSNIAQKLIEAGLDLNRTAADWVQQDLGWATEPQGDRLTPNILADCITRPVPTHQPRWVIAGGDAGRSEHWLWIMECYPPAGWQRMKTSEVFRRSIRKVVFAEDVRARDIPDILTKYKVDFGLIDNEPGRAGMAALCDRTCLEMADQKGGKLKDFSLGTVMDGGEEFPCWMINSDLYKQAVINAAVGIDENIAYDGRSSYRFPSDWQRHLVGSAENSPIRHLCSISFNALDEKWVRPADHIDDLFFAAHFAEAAFAVAIDRGVSDADISW